ncbi:right-handed parallel beta-helix repeat-containing protein [Methylomonas albis]|uniref:Right-handed parallel beta-helix repeat-containing protein n=1 Tax=Methylomonas albis TaxID=1854563 RepID=A0ABR9D6K0_9GAMM|nr:right-handed parallel beta-helix repeat-containing protein [Methylomonas albis]MBD9358406.1 right-handed parallel beta-helix repeat-containing protein [Methylomonas albis]
MLSKLVITLAILTFCSAVTAKDFYVSPSGSDSLNGLSPSANYWTKTGPFKTLARAQQAIRKLKAAGKFNEAITVHVGKGTYQLQSALEFDDRDSGLPSQEILWIGEKGTSIISGGITLKNCQPYNAANPLQILSCPLNADTVANIQRENNHRIQGNSPAFEIFINERRMHLARWPNEDWAHIKVPLDENTRFSVFEKMPQFSGDLSNAQVHIFPGNDIYDHYTGVSTIDFVNNQINLSSETIYKLTSGRRFYLQNLEAALDVQDEWFYDQTNNKILFIPPIGTTQNNIVLSSAKNLLMINDASHIGFKNLTFRHSTGAAIRTQRSESVLFDNLEINNIAGTAIYAPENTNITISNNHIHDVGTGGILISGGDRPTLTASGNLIDNNHIDNYDAILFTYSPGVSTNGVASVITHNLIENGHGNGVFLYGNDHLIEKNEISQVCQQSDDCGAIYSGRDWTYRGNIVRYNYLHDFSGYQLKTLDIANNIIQYTREGTRGIYLDDAVSGFTVFGNILVNAGSISIQLGGGRDHHIENNVIKTSTYAIYIDQRFGSYNWDNNRDSLKTMPITSSVWLTKYPELGAPMAHDTWPEGNSIQRNVILSTNSLGYSLFYVLPPQGNTVGNNLAWHASSDIRVYYQILGTFIGKNRAPWRDWLSHSIENNSINEDPCLNISGSKISIGCTNSPLSKIGFQIPPSDIGIFQ